jgi:hypothetical protein
MNTAIIEQTIDIPASRRIYFDLPESFNCDQARVTLRFEPVTAKTVSAALPAKQDDDWTKALEKAEEIWAYNRAHPEELQASLNKLKENGPIFGGIDGVDFQRKIRDEWEDRLVKIGLSDIVD